MSRELSFRERKALKLLSSNHGRFVIDSQMPFGIGPGTLDKLVRLGLAEREHSQGESGWRITEDGWRCMFGMTHEQMVAEGKPSNPLRVWRWPPRN